MISTVTLNCLKVVILLFSFTTVCASKSNVLTYNDVEGDQENNSEYTFAITGVDRDNEYTYPNDHSDRSGADMDQEDDGHDSEYTVHVTYEEIYRVLVFLITTYVAGIIAKNLGMPALVGEIATGFLLGPPLADFVPYKKAFVLVGEIGLIALLLEAGIELDVAQLRQTGTRAMAIAFTGSLLSVGIGMFMSYIFGNSLKAGLAVGASFAPTSLGVAASALGGGGMINTAVGQLIIASCVVDDIIGLILLSMFQVLVKDDAKVIEYFIPLISSFGFLILLGYPAITFLPRFIQDKFLPSFPRKFKFMAMFGLLAALTMAYLPLMNYTKSSYLTGAFLAGATFSQVPHAYEEFMHSSHSIIEWLLRVFFSASIGFQVPLKEFTSLSVIGMGFALWGTCVLIKLFVAFFVPRFEQADKDAIYNPYTRDFIVTGLSMTCRGEFSFIIAAFALSEGVIQADLYAAVVFAVLLSAITSPFMLLRCISHFRDLKEKHMAATNPKDGDDTMPLHFHICLESENAWSLLSLLQNEIRGLNLDVLDLRTGHSRGINPKIRNDVYVRDKEIRIPIVTVKAQKENQASLVRVSSKPSLFRAVSAGSLVDLQDVQCPEDLEAAENVIKQVDIEKIITNRERAIQSSLYDILQYIGITTLDVEQWNPWDWTNALDTMVLKRANGELADVKFFMEIFDKADIDRNGSLDADELYTVLDAEGMNVTKEGISAMITHVDADGDGEIDRAEWEESITHYLDEKMNKKKVSLRTLLEDSTHKLPKSAVGNEERSIGSHSSHALLTTLTETEQPLIGDFLTETEQPLTVD